MKQSRIFNVGIAMGGLLLSAAAIAQEPPSGAPMGFGDRHPPFERAMHGPGDHGRWWNNPRVIEKLKLTDDQRKAMDEALQQHREQLIDLRGSLEKAELALEPLMKEGQPNEGQVLAQIDRVAAARAELEKANARFLLAVRSKLTPDQWKQVQADRANRPHPDWGKGNMGHRGPTPPAADGIGPGAPPPGPQGRLDDVIPGPDGPGQSDDGLAGAQ